MTFKPVKPDKVLRRTLKLTALRRENKKLQTRPPFGKVMEKRSFRGGIITHDVMLHLIHDFFGISRLRNARVVEFGSEGRSVCPFLSKEFGARTVDAHGFAQDIDSEFHG